MADNIDDERAKRFDALRQAEQDVVDARMHWQRINDEVGPDADLYLWSLRVALEMSAAKQTPGPRDRDLETRGQAAIVASDTARDELIAARRARVEEIASIVRDRLFRPGDTITPLTVDPNQRGNPDALTVVAVYYPDHEPTLGEVTFTGDGGPVEKAFHSWDLDDDGRPIVDVASVPYERWWAGGLRSAGEVHPTTRKITDTA